jgi:hypothetical protein
MEKEHVQSTEIVERECETSSMLMPKYASAKY